MTDFRAAPVRRMAGAIILAALAGSAIAVPSANAAADFSGPPGIAWKKQWVANLPYSNNIIAMTSPGARQLWGHR